MSEKRNSNLLGKVTVVLVICCLVMVGLCVNTALALDGSGTQEDPWRIESLEDFNDFAADANYWDDYTRLETDVNLAGRTYTTAVIAPDVNDTENWFQGTAFTGVFNGNDHKIINLTIDGVGNWLLGLFGYIDGGEVRNLGLEGGDVSGYRYIGGLVGVNLNGSNISNCYSTGVVNGVGSFVGGLVGRNRNGSVSNCYSKSDVNGHGSVGGLVGANEYGIISNCDSTGDVDGGTWVGGLVGQNSGNVSNCYSTGDVSSDGIVGGLVGNNSGSVSNCYSTGNVSGDVNGFSAVGGLVGNNHVSVSNCYSTGNVSGYGDVSGLVGNNHGSVSNCYSTGDVNGDVYVGGLVGQNYGSVSNCYSTSDVNGVEDVGGLIGRNTDIVSNCFWNTDTQTHGVTESIGQDDGTVTNVAGLTTAQMQTRSTFTDADWDFINVWNIGENQTYPYLRVYLPSDINKDRIVNFLDIAITANQWMEEQ